MVLFTVTVTLAVPVLPLASVAVAVIVCVPLDSCVVSVLVLQAVVPVAVTGVPPSTLTCTWLIPAVSAAVPETASVPETVALLAGEVIVTTGLAVVVLFTATVTLAVPVLPLASVAVAVIVCVPLDSCVVSVLVLQAVVPVAVTGVPPSTLTCTWLIPAVSAAVPETASVPETVALLAGEVIVTTGLAVVVLPGRITGLAVAALPSSGRP